MTEKRILELLYSLSEKQNVCVQGNKFKKEYVHTVSKSLANFFYKTIKVKSATVSLKRLDFIQVLQKWCSRESNHFDITEDNLDLFLKTLTKGYSVDEDDDIVADLLKNVNQTEDDDFWSEVIDHFRKMEEREMSRKKFIKELSLLEDSELMDSVFNFATSAKDIRSDEGLESCFLKFFGDDYEKYLIKNHDIQEIYDKNSSLEFRESQVNAGLAILNLKSNSTEIFLRNILEKIGNYRTIQNFEIDFLIHLFLTHDRISDKLLENFPFIIEKPILKCCTNLIKSPYIPKDVTELIEDVALRKILFLAENNPEIKVKVLTILYKLFTLSSYNIRILKFVDIVR